MRELGWPFWMVVALAGALLLLSGVVSLNTARHGGCAKYEETGGLTCWDDKGYLHCTPGPNLRALRRRDHAMRSLSEKLCAERVVHKVTHAMSVVGEARRSMGGLVDATPEVAELNKILDRLSRLRERARELAQGDR